MTTTEQGSVGLGFAIAYFVANGYIVSLPLNDNQAYDLIVDKEGLQRVQVKTTGYKESKNNYTVQLKSTRANKNVNKVKKFDSTKSELVFILDRDGNQYLIPSCEIKVKNSFALGKKAEKWKVK